MKRCRTIFISDVHFGTKGCRANELMQFLQGHSCDHIYLVGDIIDGWQMESSNGWDKSHTDVIQHLVELVHHGIRVTFVTGNHDDFLRNFTPVSLDRLEIVDEAIHETADGRKLLVIHGDQFDVISQHHKWLAIVGDFAYGLLLAISTRLMRLQEKLRLNPWSLSAWLKYKVKQAVSFISRFEETVSKACSERELDGVVCGHVHHAENREINNIEYYNCGDWVESCTALLEDTSGRISIYRHEDAVANIMSLDLNRDQSPENVRDSESDNGKAVG